MNTTTRRQYAFTFLLLSFVTISHAQELRAFNQNASRSNHTRLSFSVTPTFSTPLNSKNDSLLFRGTGAGLRFGGDYFFGKAGIGFSSGFGFSTPADATINNFLMHSSIPLDQLTITKARQQNMYLLVGPSIEVGNTVKLYGHAKAGAFMNNSGMVNIQQKGAQRPLYRNESTDKNFYPGFLAGVSVNYKTKSEAWSIGLGLDYMYTQAEMNNYDARRGNGIEALKLSRNITDIVAGITLRYNILSPRDHMSGQSSGRVLPTVNKREITSPRDVASGLPTGRMDQSTESCGPVVQRTTNPDGSVQEMTFSCPADAAQYRQATRGDYVIRKTLSDVVPDPTPTSNAGVIEGTLTWASPGGGIITNRAIITNNTTRGGSATLNSQSSSTRQTNQSSFGTMVRMSAREASSGMATGKRQYAPVFIENGETVCNPCMASVKMSGITNNPLYKGKETMRSKADENCDGIAGVNVSLVDVQTKAVVATTETESCGDFFFANVPDGDYIVRLSATLTTQKTVDVSLQSKTDLLGEIQQGHESMRLLMNNNDEDGIIWSPRSNVKMIPITLNEAQGDTTTLGAGSKMPTEFAVLRDRDHSKNSFETGDTPTSQQRPGAPIKGVIVKGGRNPSPDITSRTTNEKGEFEFTDLDAGNYRFTIEQPLLLNDETVVSVNSNAADRNINTSESNIGKDDAMISSSPSAPALRAQNNNTVRSNRSELTSIHVEADLDGDGVYETDVTSQVKDEMTLDENGQPVVPQMKAGISTSRSNIRERSGFQSIGNELYISYGKAIINGKETAVQSILKTKHDTAKNSISNVR